MASMCRVLYVSHGVFHVPHFPHSGYVLEPQFQDRLEGRKRVDKLDMEREMSPVGILEAHRLLAFDLRGDA